MTNIRYATGTLKAYPLTPWDPEGLPLTPWDPEGLPLTPWDPEGLPLDHLGP